MEISLKLLSRFRGPLLAEQRERAANAERRLLELQQQIEPRRIADAERTRLIELLRDSPTAVVAVRYIGADPEAEAFARQIHEVLLAAGWSSRVRGSVLYTSGSPTGVRLLVRSVSQPPASSTALLEILADAGISVHRNQSSDINAGELEILVGTKP